MKHWLPLTLLVLSTPAFALTPPNQNNASQQGDSSCLKAYESGDYAFAVPKCQKAANKRDASAQTVLGLMYFYGHGVVSSNEKAIQWFKRAAAGGDAAGQFYLGRMYSAGIGLEQNDAQAFTLYMQAAKQGYVQAQWTVSLALRLGIGTPKDMDLAYEWYQSARKNGLANAPEKTRQDFRIHYYKLKQSTPGQVAYKNGIEQLLGIDGDPKPADAFALFLEAANQNHPDAQFQIGLQYLKGKGVERDEDKAIDWFYRAAEQHHRDAQAHLAWMHLLGLGTPFNQAEALSFFEDSLLPSKEELMAQQARKAKASEPGSLEWLHVEARKGNLEAQTELGLIYLEGKDVAQDLLQGYRWLQSAAQLGYGEAEYHLGLMYLEGHGVIQDPPKGIKWLKRAASHNHADAQFEIGLLYYTGRFVTRNYPQAYAWFNLSAGQNVVEAQAARTQLMNEMSEEQLISGQSLSRELYQQLNAS